MLDPSNESVPPAAHLSRFPLSAREPCPLFMAHAIAAGLLGVFYFDGLSLFVSSTHDNYETLVLFDLSVYRPVQRDSRLRESHQRAVRSSWAAII